MASPKSPASFNSASTKGEKASKTSWWRRIRLWPRSLAGQLIAALLLALIVAQIVTLIIFAGERSNLAVTTIRGQVLERTASVVRVLNQTEPSLHRRVLRAAEGPGILYRLQKKTNLPLPRAGTPEANLAKRLEQKAGLEAGSVRISNVTSHYFSSFRAWREGKPSKFVRRDFDDDHDEYPKSMHDDRSWGEKRHMAPPADRPRWSDDRRAPPRPFEGRRDGRGDRKPLLSMLDMALSVPLEDGRWLQVRTGIPTSHAKWGLPFLLSMGVSALLILLVVIVTVRKLTAPLRGLERAARQLGRGEAMEPLKEEGPKEIRSTISAFNAMQERLMRFVQDRTRMLAAISHDLRTPITTLRLRAEFIDDDEMREKVLATLEEMQAMTEGVLAFAREDASNEETKPVDLSALLSSMSEDYRELGKQVSFSGPDHLVLSCRSVSLKRAIRNLVDNAIRYAGHADIKLASMGESLTISICDKGPGIPQEKLEEVFSPFFRVEGSRNLETGGVGLGLSITRTIIRSHGGDVTLANRQGGGLCADITLPQ